jgi:hypothetical protein
MKIPYHFLLVAAFAASQPLLTDAQSLSPTDRAIPPVNQSLFAPKQPRGSIWQPLPAPKTVIPGQLSAPIPRSSLSITGVDRQPRLILPSELPSLNYSELPRDANGRLRVPTLPPGYSSNDKMPCFAPDLASIECMPVRRMSNTDPMNRMALRFRHMPEGTKKW